MPKEYLLGSFCYDATKGIALPDPKQRLIWGFEEDEVTFQEVVTRVDPPCLSVFLESVTKKEAITETPTIKLKNGRQIKEKFHKVYSPDDYEFASLLEIEGLTWLQNDLYENETNNTTTVGPMV